MLRRPLRATSWLAAASFLWAILAFVGRIPTARAAAITDVLFVLALPLTYIAAVAAGIHWSARPRQAQLRVAALTLGLLVALMLLELPAAARLVHWELVFRTLRGEEQHYVADPDLGFRHTPNARASLVLRSDVEVAWGLPASRSDRVTITYDQRGYRNPMAPTRADIVLIGDSYVEGAYVSDDQTLSRFLEASLRRPVANLGVSGYGAAQELLVLKGDALSLEPNAVIWFFFEGNDLYDDQEFENTLLVSRETRGAFSSGRHGWRRRSFARNAYAQLRLLLYPLVPSYFPHSATLKIGPHHGEKILFSPYAAFPWTDFERSRWEQAQHTLREAAEVTQKHNVKLLLIYVPIKFRVYRDFIDFPPGSELRGWTLWPLPELFAEFCRSEGFECLDLTGLLRDSIRAGGMPHALADSHWSPEGHQLIARKLEEMLTSLGWLRTPGGPRAANPSLAGVASR